VHIAINTLFTTVHANTQSSGGLGSRRVQPQQGKSESTAAAKNSTWGKPLQAGNNGKQQQQPKQKPKDSADLQSGYEASGDEQPFTKVVSRAAERRERKRLREESGLQSAAEAAETSSDERKEQPKRNRRRNQL